MAGGGGLAGMMSQLMQSPAMQQMAEPGMKEYHCISLQCLIASPGRMKIMICRCHVKARHGKGHRQRSLRASSSINLNHGYHAGAVSGQGMGGAMAGGGGLAGMMSQLMQSPAMQQMADPGKQEYPCISLQCLTASPELMKILVCRGHVRTRHGRGHRRRSLRAYRPAMSSIDRKHGCHAGAVPAQGMGGATAGGGGLAGMMSQLMQSPAMQQMAGSLADRADRQGGPQQRAAPDFGSFLQDMMPVVGQVQPSFPGMLILQHLVNPICKLTIQQHGLAGPS